MLLVIGSEEEKEKGRRHRRPFGLLRRESPSG
jgi:hypothetical protein